MSYYSDKSIKEIKSFLGNLDHGRANINKILFCLDLNKKADEYRKSISLRYNILVRAIKNIYKIYPPERIKRLDNNENNDICINFDSCIINIMGIIDNLMHLILHCEDDNYDEKNTKKLNLYKVCEDRSIDIDQNIFSQQKEFRNRLVHRVRYHMPSYNMYDNTSLPYFTHYDYDKNNSFAYHQVIPNLKSMSEYIMKVCNYLKNK